MFALNNNVFNRNMDVVDYDLTDNHHVVLDIYNDNPVIAFKHNSKIVRGVISNADLSGVITVVTDDCDIITVKLDMVQAFGAYKLCHRHISI